MPAFPGETTTDDASAFPRRGTATSRPVVCLDTSSWRSPLTGIGYYALSLSRALLQQQRRIELLSFDGDGVTPLVDRVANYREESYRTGVVSNYLRRVPLARLAYRRYKSWRLSSSSHNYDIFHALNFVAPTNLARGITIPLIYDISFERFPEVHPRERVEWLRGQLKLLDRYPCINTISEFSANEISKYYNYPRGRIIVTYPGINPLYANVGNEATKDVSAMRLRRDGFFLAVGTLEPRKNHQVLFQAYLSLPLSVRKNYPLVVAGVSGWGDVVNDEARQLVEEGSLRLLGYTAEQDLRALYRNARALLFPSVYEGFGMPAVEAMASGLPLILSDIPVLREVCGPHAIFVPPTDPNAWVGALEASISGPSRNEVSEEAIEFAKRYSWERTAMRTLEMYAAVTDGERSSAV